MSGLPTRREQHVRRFHLDHRPHIDSLCLTKSAGRYDQGFRVPRGTLFVPFTLQSYWTVDTEGFIWWVDTGQYAVHKLNFQGDTVLTVHAELPRLEVTSQDRDSAIQMLEHAMENRNRVVRLDYSRIPHLQPAIENFDIDDQGKLGVRRVSRQPFTVFDVYSPDGHYLHSVDTPWFLPDYRHTVIADETVYAVVLDSLDVRYVVRGRVEAKHRD